MFLNLLNTQGVGDRNGYDGNWDMTGTGVLPERDDESQRKLFHVDQYAFDEMNLVEIPFCLLQKQQSELQRIDLAPGGTEYLETSGKNLPTALAEPVVLGLMWMTMDKCGFREREVRFPLRELVEEYMYPGRFTKFRASGALLRAVEDELHRIKSTDLHSHRWFDKEEGKHVHIHASIIEKLVIMKGGRNAQTMVAVSWGSMIVDSVRARYTREFDLPFYLRIEHALDRRLFRWIKRQLDTKDSQSVKSIQSFGRYKMAMQGYKLERGGRTASSHVLSELTKSLKRLNGIGLAVRMVANKGKPDYSIRFDKIKGEENEVIARDAAGDLVASFHECFHFRCTQRPDGRKHRLKEKDRIAAAKWIDHYGYERAVELVRVCKKLHTQGARSQETIRFFSGLEFYEAVALNFCDRQELESDGQMPFLDRAGQDQHWAVYREQLLARAEVAIPEERKREISLDAERELESNPMYPRTTPFIREKLFAAHCRSLLLKETGGLGEVEFRSLMGPDLRTELIARHGQDFASEFASKARLSDIVDPTAVNGRRRKAEFFEETRPPHTVPLNCLPPVPATRS